MMKEDIFHRFQTLKMLTSLYLNTSTQMRKDEILQMLQSSDEQDKIEAMRQMISQMSQGEDFISLTHRITKETLVVKNNELKRLFYYYLELLSKEPDSFGEILLLSNQIRKDLEHPNEYVRGFVMRFVSKLGDPELIGNFYKLVKDNFNHPHAYVRRHAYFCLGTIYCKIGTHKEIPDILYHALFRDLDPGCLRQAFVSLHSADTGLALKYAEEASTSIPSDLSTVIIEKIQDQRILEKFLLSDDNLTALEAALSIHRIGCDEELMKRSTDIILKCLVELSNYKEYAIDCLSSSTHSFSNHSMDFLSLIDPYDLGFCTKCLDFVFKIAETHEFIQISEFLCHKLMSTSDVSVQNQNFKVLLFEKMGYFASAYSTYNEDMIDEALKNVISENPAVSYASLRFISSCFEIMNRSKDMESGSKYSDYLMRLIEKINAIKYGKILRYCFETLRKQINKDIFERMMEILDSSFDLVDKPLYLTNTQTFIGSFICIELAEMCKEMGEDFRSKTIAIMLKFISYGKESKTIDLSSHSTITSCIRSLLSPGESTSMPSDDYERCNEDVLNPIVSPGIKINHDRTLNQLNEFLCNKDSSSAEVGNVVQLTGLSDPIYVEATVSYTRFEILIEMLFINQTSSYLQNILIDFVSSQNLGSSFVSSPFSLSSRSVVTKAYSFRMVDASNGFISGSMTFRYPGESGEYANATYNINLSEIKTSVSEFLEPRRMTSEEFREMWKELEWENTYTLKFMTNWSLEDIFNGVTGVLKGEVLDFECDDDYAVGNVVCSTLQNVYVLVNMCLRREECVHFESRIRSRKEGIVKSVSVIVGDVLKSFRNK